MPVFLSPADVSTQNMDQDGHAVSRGSGFVPPPFISWDDDTDVDFSQIDVSWDAV